MPGIEYCLYVILGRPHFPDEAVEGQKWAGQGARGALSPHTYPLVHSTGMSLVEKGTSIPSDRGYVRMGCHGERGSRGPYPLRWHIPVCSERRHVEDGGSAMDPWGGNGCEGVLLEGGSRSFC